MTAEPPRLRVAANAAERAFEAVYTEHHDFVRRSVRSLGVGEDAADDVTQDVFIIVHRRLPGFDHGAPVKAWVFGIARNLARKHRDRQPHRQPRARPALHVIADDQAGPDEAMHWREAAAVVHRFVRSLDEDKRAVFVLAELEGMTAPEVAETLGIKLNTAYSRLRAARERFGAAVARARARTNRMNRGPS